MEWIIDSQLLPELQTQLRRNVGILREVGKGVAWCKGDNRKQNETDSDDCGYRDQ